MCEPTTVGRRCVACAAFQFVKFPKFGSCPWVEFILFQTFLSLELPNFKSLYSSLSMTSSNCLQGRSLLMCACVSVCLYMC